METEDGISRMENQPEVEPAVEEEVCTEVAPEGTTVMRHIPLVETVPEGGDETTEVAPEGNMGQHMPLVDTIPEGGDETTEVAPEGTTIVQHIPLVDTVQEAGDENSVAAEQRMATVQLGDLSGHSIQDLAEHLPNIGIHFTCKKCNISCNQMSEVLAHFTDGNCTGHLTCNTAADQTKTTPAPIIIRKRGRPKKVDKTPREPLFTVSKEAEYEELPRIAAPVTTPQNATGRRTRYSEGKIKRLDVLTLLGGRIKEEPLDEDDEYTPPPQALLRKRALEDDEGDDTLVVRRPRGRPKKIRLHEENPQAPTEVMGFSRERMELHSVDDGEGGVASLTIERAGNSQVIVVNKLKPERAAEDHEEEPGEKEHDETSTDNTPLAKGARVEAGGVEAGGVEAGGVEAGGAASQTADVVDHSDNEETRDGEEEGGEPEEEDEEDYDDPSTDNDESSPVSDRAEKLRKATQRTVYSYTNAAQKKRQNKCRICKQRFFYTLDELQLHTECHTNLRGEREGYGCVAADCTYVTNFWNRMLDHIITHPDYRERLRNAPFLKNIVGTFSCPICKKKFERKNNMKGHLSKVHFKQDRTCEICNMTMTSADEKTYKRHVEKCQNLLFQCSHCEYKSPVSANMRKHMKIHLGQGFTCDVCNALFPTKQRYAVHRAIHEHTRQRFMCEVCGQAFMSQDAVKKHVVRFHVETNQLFACPECVFTSKIHTDLKKHITSVHNKKFQCPHCPFQTNSPTAFEQHSEYHKPGRSFACGYANCFYRGATGKQLSNHIGQVHKLSSKHECPVCHKLYKKKTHLARHLVVHTGDKPYVCLDCDMAFSSHSTYYRHRQRTGHDSKREGIVSVPQNITIQYVSQQDLAMVEAEGAQKLVQSLHDPEAYQVVQEGETVEYVTQTSEEQPVTEETEKQNVIILENENGEQVTYLLKLNEEDGVATIVSEDGVQMDAVLAQQIHAQLQQLQQAENTEQNQLEEVVIAAEEQDALQVTTEDGLTILQGEAVEEEETQVVYATQEDAHSHQVQVVEEEEVQHEGVSEEQVLHMDADGDAQSVLIVQQEEGDVEQDAAQHLEQNWVHLTEDGLVTSDVIHVQEADGEQEIQQVIYEESVVEVDNPHGGDNDDTQYAIVLLPSSAACGAEPEAALSMLQLQSGSNMVMGENDVIIQQPEEPT